MSYSDVFLNGSIVDCPSINDIEVQKFDQNGFSIETFFLNYLNYSVLHNPWRRFPYFTAANIDGSLFKKIPRDQIFENGRDNWKKDDRIHDKFQLGKELYTAIKSNFDKGHLTKREDVQWGKSIDIARKASASTFFFTNAVPQVDRLNRGVWRRIEDYILHQEVVKNKMKISLFTGPILQEDDPAFVTKVKGETIKLPYLFWKVIYYIKDNELYRTAFITSQKGLLARRRIIKPVVRGKAAIEKDFFLDFKDAETYQVRVDFIEKIGQLKFTKASEIFVKETAEELILSGVDVRSEKENDYETMRINLKL